MLLSKQAITDYTATNISESYPDWATLTQYTIGEIVRDGNFYWKAAVSIPDTNTVRPTEAPTKWSQVRASNRYAMLDTSSITYTDNQNNTSGDPTEGIIVEFDNARYDIIAFGGVISDLITIEFSADDFVTIDETITIENQYWVTDNSEANWYSYYYGEFTEEGDLTSFFRNITPRAGKIRVTIAPSSVDNGLAQCSYMVCGNSVYAGATLSGVDISTKDWSVREYDAFGTLNIVKRNIQQIITCSTVHDRNYTIPLYKSVKKLRSTHILIVGDEADDSQFENILMLGTIEDDTTKAETSPKNFSDFMFVESI